jgi:hypothetical protein
MSSDNPGLGNFYTAITVEYFSSPVTAEEVESIIEKYRNISISILRPQRLVGMPAGSIMAKMIDNQEVNDVMIFYPFFPHLNTPVKAGEQIIVLYGSPARGDRIGYWMTRKPADLVAEDVNYTHNDRSNYTAGIVSQDAAATIARKFPDNGYAAISYKSLVENSNSYKDTFQGEVVPRYFPKSPDTSIQGSNNTLVVLGSNATLGKEKSVGSGMIDIVVGRGQTPTTAPKSTYVNDRSYSEVDKKGERNSNEGNLDLINDLARINISSGLNVDEDFGINVGDNSGDGPAVVVNSDQIRILARQDLKIVVGSGSSQSSILVKNDGNIVVTPGSQIKLSSEEDDQPYLRYDQFNDIVSKILDIAASLQTLTTLLGSVPAAPGVPPGISLGIVPIPNPIPDTFPEDFEPPAGPLPGTNALVEISTASGEILNLLTTIKSKKILGS